MNPKLKKIVELVKSPVKSLKKIATKFAKEEKRTEEVDPNIITEPSAMYPRGDAGETTSSAISGSSFSTTSSEASTDAVTPRLQDIASASGGIPSNSLKYQLENTLGHDNSETDIKQDLDDFEFNLPEGSVDRLNEESIVLDIVSGKDITKSFELESNSNHSIEAPSFKENDTGYDADYTPNRAEQSKIIAAKDFKAEAAILENEPPTRLVYSSTEPEENRLNNLISAFRGHKLATYL